MNLRLITLASLTLALAAPGCDFPGPGGTACTDIAVASLSLQVVDAQTGDPVPMPIITFTVDGDGEVREPVEDFGGDFVLAYEETGTFEVTVAAEGYLEAGRTYDIVMDEDGCHPVGQLDVIELELAP